MAGHRGHKASAAARARMSAARRGKKHPHRGHPMSASTRSKLAAARRGKKHPHRGHPISAATRSKLAAARRGKHHPHRGHIQSAATRLKIAAALRARHSAAAAAAGRGSGPRGVVRPHRPHRSPFSRISVGAGYHRHYNGRLRRVRRHASSAIRVRSRMPTHHVRPRRR